MRNRNCWVWIAFALCACLVVAAMLWLTRSVLSTEKERAVAEIRAELQERVRLSLWRMDSIGTSILLEENSVSAAKFISEPATALPALARFESHDGENIRGTGGPSALVTCQEFLPTVLTKKTIPEPKEKIPEKSEKYEDYVAPPQSKLRGGDKLQEAANLAEKANRDRTLDNALWRQKLNQTEDQIAQPFATGKKINAPFFDNETTYPVTNFKNVWAGDSLFLVRRSLTEKSFAQGSLIDVTKLEALLLTEAFQLLPNASLTRVSDEPDDSLILASFPFKLAPGGIGAAPESIPRTISISLLVGWLAALIALLTAYFLIANVMKLSERRASFVSAVTHELRTPLTTFRLYSEMLMNGVVKEEKRPAYLGVLSREADRLSHLVENVLAFSQIERGSARSTVSEVELYETLETMRERFESRLVAAGLHLDLTPSAPIRVKLDTTALEHILFNLIDNAAKYATGSTPPTVSISIAPHPGKIEVTVADHGPGIPKSDNRRIFRPFHKSAKQAAETRPGVGLGLALSQRLARRMGGSLTCGTHTDGTSGAKFTLSLPRP
ncbi:MAG: sensor histidine kinase [Luteolibacter sp.]